MFAVDSEVGASAAHQVGPAEAEPEAEDATLGVVGPETLARYRPRVLGLCRRILRGRASAEDACQETLARAFAGLPGFRQGTPVWPWLATIAGNVCRDLLRADRPVEPLDATALEASTVPGPEEAARLRSRTRLVHDAFAAMPGPYRATVYLREIEGWNYAEIAEVGVQSVPAVRTRLMRGRRVLAAHIERLARERREWPLAGVTAGGALLRRARARLTQVQTAVEGAMANPLWLMEAVRSAGWVSLVMVVPTVATAAAAAAGLSVLPITEPPGPTLARDEVALATVAPLQPVSHNEPSPAEDKPSPQPAVTVGRAQARADGDARIATPDVAIATEARAPGTDSASNRTVYVGPVGVYCGAEERRRMVMTAVCDTLGD